MAIPRVKFFGAFLSSSTGTSGPSELISQRLTGIGKCSLVSSHVSPMKRLYQSLRSALFDEIDIAILDVYSTRVVYQTVFILWLLKVRNIRTIAVFHGGSIIDKWASRGWVFKNFLKLADVVTTPSKRMALFASIRGFNLRYLPNPIDLEHFTISTQEVRRNLLWVRAFSDIYNPEIPIRTLAVLKDEFPSLGLTMVGPDKGIRYKSEELVRQLNLQDSVTFVGPVPNRELSSFYKSHSIFLNTTSFESFGTAVVEAAAMEMPIVSSEVGELPYLWSDKENILFAKKLIFGL